MLRQIQKLRRLCAGFCLFLFSLRLVSGAEARFTSVEPIDDGFVLHGEARAPELYPPYTTLYASSNLVDWREIARLHNSYRFKYLHLGFGGAEYFRFETQPLEGADWSNQIRVYNEPFGSYGQSTEMPYVKFVIKLSEPDKVYFSSATAHLFHYDFVTARLQPYVGISREHFAAISRRNVGRELLVGAVLLARQYEYGIQFESDDPLPLPMVKRFLETVRRRVVEVETTNAAPASFYVPTYEQAGTTLANPEFFETNQIAVTTLERWFNAPVAYSSGLAVGMLKFVAASNLNSAYASGELTAQDILLTDAIPAEMPYVAGIISLKPATPNSHVAILADTYHVPFGYHPSPLEQARALALVGKEIAFETIKPGGFYAGTVNFLGVDPNIPAPVREAIYAFRRTNQISIPAYELPGVLTKVTDTLTPNDLKYFGGKAANFGFLRRALPNESPEAIAFSFQLWDEFMAQNLGTGRTLREEIAFRLGPHTNLNDIVSLKAALLEVRETLIRRTASFTPDQQARILAALDGFDTNRNIRFRSSTNVEDSENFTGAGLYDSFSGCKGDDLDADNRGPSLCDPTEDDERGVFRAIQRVFASFYNDNAYLARRLFGLDESATGMALLVHYSTPDPIEMANGVATYTKDLRDWPRWWVGNYDLVTQKGAVSVTNPESSAQPETTRGVFGIDFEYEYFGRNSELVPAGARVLEIGEYPELVGLLHRVAAEYEKFAPRGRYALDFEYKKIEPGHLSVKQVRPIPLPDTTPNIDPVLLDHVLELVTPHRINFDAFTAHRLKSNWKLRAKNMIVTTNSIKDGILAEIDVTKAGHAELYRFVGGLEALNARLAVTNKTIYVKWNADTADGPAEYILRMQIYDSLPRSFSNSLFERLDSLNIELNVKYQNPVFGIDWLSDIVTRTEEWASLNPPRPSDSGAYPFHWDLLVTNQTENISIKVDYKMDGPNVYTGYPSVIGPLSSDITGLTSKPIRLRGVYSQTFEGVHWRTSERFIFEPRLEEGIDPEIVAELQARNIRLLLYTHVSQKAILRAMGFDGQLREIAWGVGVRLP